MTSYLAKLCTDPDDETMAWTINDVHQMKTSFWWRRARHTLSETKRNADVGERRFLRRTFISSVVAWAQLFATKEHSGCSDC